MKQISLTALLVLLFGVFFGQTMPSPQAVPYFSAVIVKNLDSSIHWYASLFGLKTKTRISDSAGNHIGILESPVFLMELLQLKGSLMKESILQNQPPGTVIMGHFKFGFKISSVESWLNHLTSLNIKVDRVYTDSESKKRNFLINDPDGNLIQFFE